MIVDLSHPIEEGMTTYPGLPGPRITAHLSREASAAVYEEGTTFEIARIDMVGNTGTYVDAPWHRFEGGTDLADLPLESMADVPVLLVDHRGAEDRAVTAADLTAALNPDAVAGTAVLVLTGWDRHWGTPTYGDAAPYLTGEAADWLVERAAALVGIDSVNIDDATGRSRPAHTALLAAAVPVLEHLTNLAALVDLPGDPGIRLHAAALPVRRFGTSPVRAYAVIGAV